MSKSQCVSSPSTDCGQQCFKLLPWLSQSNGQQPEIEIENSSLSCFLSGYFITVMDIKLEQWPRREERHQSGQWVVTEAYSLRDLERWGRANRDIDVIDVERDGERGQGDWKRTTVGLHSAETGSLWIAVCLTVGTVGWTSQAVSRIQKSNSQARITDRLQKDHWKCFESSYRTTVWWGRLSKYLFLLCTR